LFDLLNTGGGEARRYFIPSKLYTFTSSKAGCCWGGGVWDKHISRPHLADTRHRGCWTVRDNQHPACTTPTHRRRVAVASAARL